MNKNRLALALLLPLGAGCDLFVRVEGRTYGTRDARLAGIQIVDGKAAIEALESQNPAVWRLAGVKFGRWDLSDAGGNLVNGSAQCRHLFGFLAATDLSFAKDGYRTETTSIWASELAGKQVIAVLLQPP